MYQNVLMRIYCVLQMQKLVSFNINYNEIREDKALCLKSEVICIDQYHFDLYEVSLNVRLKRMFLTRIMASPYNCKTKQEINKYKTHWT